MSDADKVQEGMQKLMLFHIGVREPVTRAEQRIADLIEAYGVKGMKQGSPEFSAAIDKSIVHILKIMNEAVVSVEEGIHKYYQANDSSKIFKPATPKPGETK